MEFLEDHFHPILSAFRPGFGCQTALLKIVEDWKRALDDNKYIAAISMDLSKAFDCLPHNLRRTLTGLQFPFSRALLFLYKGDT
jgi:hypothetical protein